METQRSDVQKSVAAVKKTVTSAFNTRRVGDAVKKAVEKDERGKNVVIFGIPEDITQTLETRVGGVLENLGKKPRIVDCCRLGKEQEGAVRPVKVTLTNSSIASELLRKSKVLKDVEACRQIFICPDRTVEHRKIQKGLIDQLKKKRTENPGTRYCIRSGRVVVSDNSQP